jgi:hypothetical protein
VKEIVFRAIEHTKELALDETSVPDSETAVLLGEGTGLDSMGFVNFVVAVENEMSRITRKPLAILDSVSSPALPGDGVVTVGDFIDLLHDSLQA